MLKVLILFIGAITPLMSFAGGGELSGGSPVQMFESLSPGQALFSNKFDRRVQKMPLPGTSTYYNPVMSLCLNDRFIETNHPSPVSVPIIYPKTKCVLWKARRDGKWKTYTSKRAAEGRKDRHATCIEEKDIYVPLPTKFNVEFYEKTFNSKNKLGDFVGEHEFRLPPCDVYDKGGRELLKMFYINNY